MVKKKFEEYLFDEVNFFVHIQVKACQAHLIQPFLPANGRTGKNFNFKGQRKGKSCPNPGLPLHNNLNFNNYPNFPGRHISCWTMK
jgi:hypothetical protein